MFEMFEMQGLVDLVELEVGVNYKGLRFLIDLSENKRVLAYQDEGTDNLDINGNGLLAS